MAQKIGPDPFVFGPWKVESSIGPIMGQEALQELEAELEMKSLPDMIFAKNALMLKFNDTFELAFNAKDALKTCDKKCPSFQVAAAQSWTTGFKYLHLYFNTDILFK